MERSTSLITAVDLGTNTLLAITGQRRSDGTLVIVADRHAITRLGENVDDTRRLSPQAMDRTLVVLRQFIAEARRLGTSAIAAVATSAVRDAENREVFLDKVRDIVGADVNVIGGEREAALTFRGASLGISSVGNLHALVFDIGGGSTEIAFGRLDAAPLWCHSIDVGSVRLTERFAPDRSIGAEALEAMAAQVRAQLVHLPKPCRPYQVVGVAATVMTLMAVHAKGDAGFDRILATDDLDRVVNRLGSMSLADRQRLAGLDPARADVIPAGGIIAREIVRWCNSDRLCGSQGGVRVGLLLERLDRL
jgi:exopolyphosphatase/guanosine-5'-triphosphate,3'-diphosphate pyrophosphatase